MSSRLSLKLQPGGGYDLVREGKNWVKEDTLETPVTISLCTDARGSRGGRGYWAEPEVGSRKWEILGMTDDSDRRLAMEGEIDNSLEWITRAGAAQEIRRDVSTMIGFGFVSLKIDSQEIKMSL